VDDRVVTRLCVPIRGDGQRRVSGDPGKPADGATTPQSLATRLDLLFRTSHRPGEPEPTYQDVADAIAAEGGPAVGAAYLYMLRTGRRASPRLELLTSLAKYFKVPVSYLLGEEGSDQLSDELELLIALRDHDVRRLALRSQALSADSRKAIAAMIEQLRKAEGLRDDEDSSASAE
jgi:transcriptional regulator with XRE-family HTH domain